MNKTLKRILIDIIVGIVCIGIITGILIYEKHKNKTTEYDENNANSAIVLRLYDEDGDAKINQVLNFTDGESIYSIIERNYHATYKENAVGKALLSIEEYETDFTTCYFAFYVKRDGDSDFTYSNHGVEGVKAEDKMEVEFRWTKIKLG